MGESGSPQSSNVVLRGSGSRVRVSTFRRLALALSTLLVSTEGIAQGAGSASAYRWQLPGDLIAEYVIDLGGAAVAIGERGSDHFWRGKGEQALARTEVKCRAAIWFVAGRGQTLFALDTSRARLIEIDENGNCSRSMQLRTTYPVVRDIAIESETILVLSSDRAVRPKAVSIQAIDAVSLQVKKSIDIQLPTTIRRPLLDLTTSEWNVADRQYPFSTVAVDPQTGRVWARPLHFVGFTREAGLAIDSFWVSLPAVKFNGGRSIRTIADLRSPKRLTVETDCKGDYRRISEGEDDAGIVLYRTHQRALFAIKRDTSTYLLRFPFSPGETC